MQFKILDRETGKYVTSQASLHVVTTFFLHPKTLWVFLHHQEVDDHASETLEPTPSFYRKGTRTINKDRYVAVPN